jgi:uncharacterized cupin superfamily protein
MPKLSKDSAPNVEEFGPALDISGEVDDYTVNFVTIKQAHSLAGMFKGFPGEACPCPHWGYVFAGRITVGYKDHEEVYEAGDAFYMPPGHVPAAETGSEFVQFSSREGLAEVRDVMMRNAKEMRGA